MTLNHEMKIKGAKQLREKWDGANARLAGPARAFFQRSIRTIRSNAIGYTLVDTGRLRSSYMFAIGPQRVPESATIFNPVRYAGHLEAKRGAKPRGVGRIPFFGPAIKASQRAVSGYARRLLKEFTQAMRR